MGFWMPPVVLSTRETGVEGNNTSRDFGKPIRASTRADKRGPMKSKAQAIK
jgi:hypothetical protein